ncbi:MAG: MBL fold metallo-hydrolase [Gemmatales bacterium]|nr:MBL fold metallo-hydrolase [Gemmatales bacterium]MDW8386532.1 MBL fold metallo-hydrolase [Gemmatales bacterium]
MRLCMLGTAGYHPNETRHTACCMLPSQGFVLDAGTGFFRVRDHLVTPRLHVFLTHVHLDHVAGLTFLLDVLWEKPVESVTVHALPEHLDVVRKQLFGSLLFPVEFRYRTQPVQPEFEVEGVRVRTCPLDHGTPCIGYRFDWPDRSLAYVTDTRCSERYADFVRGVDLLIHECNFPDRLRHLADLTGHSVVSDVLRLARKAEVRRLCLTHFNPLLTGDDPAGLDQAETSFPGVIVAADGLQIDF